MRRRSRRLPLAASTVASTVAGALLALGCADAGTGTGPARGTGTLVVQLTDAPFPLDSLKSVDVFVVRIDGKQAASDSADADRGTDDAGRDQGGWTTLAEPKARVDLLALQHGTTSTLGQKALTTGTYKSFRLIIDPSQSSIALRSGQLVDVKWPSAARSGIKVALDHDVTIGSDSTKTLVVDFDVGESFTMRGNGLRNGLTFKPVIRATTH